MEISGNLAITYVFKKNRWTQRQSIPLNQFEYNIPPNINAVFESKDENIYFIRRDKYCKRKLKTNKKVFPVIFESIISIKMC